MCNQREKTSLDHLYSTHRDAYKALPRPQFGKSDHNYILLIPAYKQKIKAGSISDSAYKKSDQMKQMLNYLTVLLAQTGLCSDGIEEYTTSVTGFLNECMEDIVPKVTVRTYPK